MGCVHSFLRTPSAHVPRAFPGTRVEVLIQNRAMRQHVAALKEERTRAVLQDVNGAFGGTLDAAGLTTAKSTGSLCERFLVGRAGFVGADKGLVDPMPRLGTSRPDYLLSRQTFRLPVIMLPSRQCSR